MLTAPTPEQIQTVVHDRIRFVLAEHGKEVGPLSDEDKLNATLGLSSLDLAILVAELEAELGVDPFVKLVSITSIRSVGDLVRSYQQALYPELQPQSQDDDAVAAALDRARVRRARRER